MPRLCSRGETPPPTRINRNNLGGRPRPQEAFRFRLLNPAFGLAVLIFSTTTQPILQD